MTELKTEEKLILSSLKLKPTDDEIVYSNQLMKEITNWQYLIKTAIGRGIGPLLFNHIKLLENKNLIPKEFQLNLQQSYLKTLGRSMRLHEAYKEVATNLNSQGVKHIVLKGIYLAENLYHDIGLRQLSDIDILVPVSEIKKCVEVMNQLGYHYSKPELFHSEFVKNNSDIVHKPPMIKGDISVEIHLKLHYFSENASFRITDMINDSETANVNGIKTRTLQLYDFLIHLCVHLNKHFVNGHVQFTNYSDIINLIEENRNNFNWDTFIERCEFHRCKEIVFNQLYLVNKLCDVEIPNIQLNFPDNNQQIKSESMFIFYLRGGTFKSEYSRSLMKSLKRFSSVPDKLHYLWDIINPSKEYMINYYQIKTTKFYFLYYLKRYFQLIKSVLSEGYIVE